MSHRAASCLLLVLVSGCTPGSVAFDEQHSLITVAADLSGTVSITTSNVRAGADDFDSLRKAAAACDTADSTDAYAVEQGLTDSLLTSIGLYELEWRSEPRPNDSCDLIVVGRFRYLPSLLASIYADGTYSIEKTPGSLSVQLAPLPSRLAGPNSTLLLRYAGVVESSNADEILGDGATHRWAGDAEAIRFKLGITSVER